MTLAQAPLLVDGATHSAQTFRMMIKDLSRGMEGITEAMAPDDSLYGTARLKQMTATPRDDLKSRVDAIVAPRRNPRGRVDLRERVRA